jgi:hypothetical protein
MCFADPKGSWTSSQGIRESISVMATTLNFYILLKIIANLLQLATYLFRMTRFVINPLNDELNPIRHLLALTGATILSTLAGLGLINILYQCN